MWKTRKVSHNLWRTILCYITWRLITWPVYWRHYIWRALSILFLSLFLLAHTITLRPALVWTPRIWSGMWCLVVTCLSGRPSICVTLLDWHTSRLSVGISPGSNSLDGLDLMPGARGVPFRGIPTTPEAFLWMPDVFGLRSSTRPTLKRPCAIFTC